MRAVKPENEDEKPAVQGMIRNGDTISKVAELESEKKILEDKSEKDNMKKLRENALTQVMVPSGGVTVVEGELGDVTRVVDDVGERTPEDGIGYGDEGPDGLNVSMVESNDNFEVDMTVEYRQGQSLDAVPVKDHEKRLIREDTKSEGRNRPEPPIGAPADTQKQDAKTEEKSEDKVGKRREVKESAGTQMERRHAIEEQRPHQVENQEERAVGANELSKEPSDTLQKTVRPKDWKSKVKRQQQLRGPLGSANTNRQTNGDREGHAEDLSSESGKPPSENQIDEKPCVTDSVNGSRPLSRREQKLRQKQTTGNRGGNEQPTRQTTARNNEGHSDNKVEDEPAMRKPPEISTGSDLSVFKGLFVFLFVLASGQGWALWKHQVKRAWNSMIRTIMAAMARCICRMPDCELPSNGYVLPGKTYCTVLLFNCFIQLCHTCMGHPYMGHPYMGEPYMDDPYMCGTIE